ncbi:acetyltransferase, GNAT family [Thamnocephalis sphaerospora]|uniref:Acetyltransferase, GNAT family n=1 Tax=Thamnocephalis sphaerospora TaxID=78915 RepID=A0A4V1IWN3_9FUNG|nr:acetyltransferase, GNAT family [Thamnocephalis sphaerospora]|eukprot:RKP08159.1 acetyltransferase, GNAT family [Thamnocephalis sphaerospora]
MDARNVTVVKLTSPEQLKDAYEVRVDVFVHEQGVPVEIEVDEHDATADHWIAYYEEPGASRVAVGTVRLVKYDATLSALKLARFCVKKAYRSLGIGRLLLETIDQYARDNDIERIYMHAQQDKVGFYEKNGYQVYDADLFFEGGIPHVKMDKQFSKA